MKWKHTAVRALTMTVFTVYLILAAFFCRGVSSASISEVQKNINSNQISGSIPAGAETASDSGAAVSNGANPGGGAISDDDVIKAQNAINASETTSGTAVQPPAANDGSRAGTTTQAVENLRGVVDPDLDGLNVRNGPWGPVLGRLYGGKFVKITGEEGDWFVIDHNGQKGYVLKSNLRTNRGVKSNMKRLAAISARVTGCSNLGLNVRDGAWGEKIGHLTNGTPVTVIGEDGDWYKIEFEGRVGFVYKAYIETGQAQAARSAAEPSPTVANGATRRLDETETDDKSVQKLKPASPGATRVDADGFLAVPERSQRAAENGAAGNYYCGPTSLGMALDYFGVHKTTKSLAQSCGTTPSGTTAGALVSVARNAGLTGSYMKEGMSINSLKATVESGKPVIVNVDTQGYWGGGHYMVAVGVADGKVYLNDPWAGKMRSYTFAQFAAQWSTRNNRGIVIQP